MLCRFAALLLLVLAVASSGCASHETDVPAEQALGSPKQTVAYLRWAFGHAPADDRPRHVWNCLSENFKATNKITLSDLELFWKEVDEKLRKYLGDVETVEIVAQRPIDRRRTEVDLASGEHRATLLFVLETEYEIRPRSGRIESASGAIPTMTDALRYENDRAIITLPNVQKPIDPEDVFRVTIENGWKVDRILRHNLDELERAMRGTKKAPEGL